MLSGTVGMQATLGVLIDFYCKKMTLQASDFGFFIDSVDVDHSEVIEDYLFSDEARNEKMEICVDVRHKQDTIVLLLAGSNEVSFFIII